MALSIGSLTWSAGGSQAVEKTEIETLREQVGNPVDSNQPGLFREVTAAKTLAAKAAKKAVELDDARQTDIESLDRKAESHSNLIDANTTALDEGEEAREAMERTLRAQDARIAGAKKATVTNGLAISRLGIDVEENAMMIEGQKDDLIANSHAIAEEGRERETLARELNLLKAAYNEFEEATRENTERLHKRIEALEAGDLLRIEAMRQLNRLQEKVNDLVARPRIVAAYSRHKSVECGTFGLTEAGWNDESTAFLFKLDGKRLDPNRHLVVASSSVGTVAASIVGDGSRISVEAYKQNDAGTLKLLTASDVGALTVVVVELPR